MAVYTPQTGVPIGDASPYDLKFFTQGYDDGSASIFEYGGALFAFSNWSPAALFDGLVVSKSTDGGVTWTNLDTANGPLASGGGAACAGAAIQRGSILTVTWIDATLSPNFHLLDFDLATGLWGSDYGMAGYPTTAVGGLISVWYRGSSNTLVVIYQSATSPVFLQLSVYDLTGGTWTGPIDVTTNITGLPNYVTAAPVIERMSACIDANDNIYLFFSTALNLAVSNDWSYRVFMQQYTAADGVPNTAAGFFDFPGQGDSDASANDFNTQSLDVPCVVGSNLFFSIDRYDSSNPPFKIQYQCGYLAVGLPSISTWVESTIPIDPDHVLGTFPNTALPSGGMSFFDGATLYCAYRGNSDPSDTDTEQIRLTQCTPTGNDPSAFTWSAQTVCLVTDPPMGDMSSPFFFEPTVFSDGDTVQVDVTAFELGGAFNSARFFMGNANGVIPPEDDCFPAWLVINEPGTTSPFTPNVWTDQSHRLHVSEAISISWIVRQRGTAHIPLTIDDDYMPTIGSQVCLWDITETDEFEVFSGTIDDFEVKWNGQTGQKIVTLTCVSLDQVFDTIRVPNRLFENQTAGFIFTALFAYASGSPVTLGTVDAGATIANFLVSDFPSIAECFTRLATLSEYVWGVDPGTGSVYFTPPNTTASPFTLNAEDVLWEQFTLKEERHDYRNWQGLKVSDNVAVQSSELFDGAGQSNFTMLRPISQITNAWLTQNVQNFATGTFTGQPSAGDTISFGFTSGWTASAVIAMDQIIVDVNGYAQKCTVPGTTGLTEPVWIEVYGEFTTDNTVQWQNQGVAGFGSGLVATYTFVAALDNRQFGQVLIGGTLVATIQNLADAINSIQDAAGLTFSLPTWENPEVNADEPPTSTQIVVRNKPAGSGFVTALHESCANFSWSSDNTTGGVTTFGTSVITFGVRGQTTGGNIFTIVYTPGSDIVSSATPLDVGNRLQIQYQASNAGYVRVENTADVTARAIIEDGTGKYQQTSGDDQALSLPEALQLAQQQLAAFGVIPQTFQFTCMRAGLYVGQVLTILMDNPSPSLTNANWFIQEIRAEVVPIYGDNGLSNRFLPNGGHFKYTVTCIDVAQIGSWIDFWLGLGGGSSGGGSFSGSGALGPSGGGSGSGFSQAFTTADFPTLTVTHGLNTSNITWALYDASGNWFIPAGFQVVDANTVTVTFGVATNGTIVIIGG